MQYLEKLVSLKHFGKIKILKNLRIKIIYLRTLRTCFLKDKITFFLENFVKEILLLLK